jgi:hypothetical protein
MTDGNLVLYNAAKTALWNSGTFNRGVGPYCALLQPNRDFVLYDSRCTALWRSNTAITDRPANADNTCRTYRVQSGDWCAKIADDNGISIDMLVRYNPGLACLPAFTGQIDQRLCVTLGTLPPPTLPAGQTNGDCRFLDVVDGDTCDSLKNKCGLFQDQFNFANPGLSCSLLQVNQRVCCSAGTKPSRRPPTPIDGNCFPYDVQDGDTCGSIAAKFDLAIPGKSSVFFFFFFFFPLISSLIRFILDQRSKTLTSSPSAGKAAVACKLKPASA